VELSNHKQPGATDETLLSIDAVASSNARLRPAAPSSCLHRLALTSAGNPMAQERANTMHARYLVRLSFACSMAGLGWIMAIDASAAADLTASLPRTYGGDFRWYGDTVQQQVQYKIIKIERRDATHLEARGCGRYDVAGKVTSILIRMEIEEPTLAVEIWESEPIGSGAASFLTQGVHRGKFSDDLSSIDAEWTTFATGEQGRLLMHAIPTVSCADETAVLMR
jgi:hypothetical protein